MTSPTCVTGGAPPSRRALAHAQASTPPGPLGLLGLFFRCALRRIARCHRFNMAGSQLPSTQPPELPSAQTVPDPVPQPLRFALHRAAGGWRRVCGWVRSLGLLAWVLLPLQVQPLLPLY